MSVPDATRYACIHGHFYQPPRENPWLETIEIQDSAAPYHDWNERVTAECYAPNAVARVLDSHGVITALRNNYEAISFNFGPTLLSWMEIARPDVYAAIVDADRTSAQRFGQGNALAQVYGHCIMPLASPRDQRTQVRWGIADFMHRFGRRPHGMWLPETAVERATLRVLAEEGIRFTILAPSQAARVRYAEHDWEPVETGGIDTTRPYQCSVGPGLAITVFFYDGDIAHGVAFGGLLNDGHALARRLTEAAARPGTPLAHIATDGESYGHHHRFGEMALAAAISSIERDGQVQLTNYAAYLDRVQVHDEVEVREASSWSCVHGVERWRADCGCNAGHPEWQQAWRTPLREAMDWLKEQLDDVFERSAGALLQDPWATRDAYISVVLQRDRKRCDAFVAQHSQRLLTADDRSRLWTLLEMQRHGMLCLTSCGWFFDEPSGLETVQVLTYAARAMQLASEFGTTLEPEWLTRLSAMHSNVPRYADGRQLYDQLVRPRGRCGLTAVTGWGI